MGILATRVKFFLALQDANRAPGGGGGWRTGRGIRYRRVDELCAVATDWGAERRAIETPESSVPAPAG